MSLLFEKFEAILGEKSVFYGERLKEVHFSGNSVSGPNDINPLVLLKPKTTEQVSAIVKLCHESGHAIVPHGGLTGLVEGTNTGKQEVAKIGRASCRERV